MAIKPTRPTVDTTARLITRNTSTGDGTGSDASAQDIWVQNVTLTATVFLGGDNTVTAANGAQWPVAKGDLFLSLEPGEELWGILAAAQPTQTIHVLQGGR